MLIVSNISFQYDNNKKLTGFFISVDGEADGIQALSSQVHLKADELDLSFVPKVVLEKIIETLSIEKDTDN